jgi:hypothetical protein
MNLKQTEIETIVDEAIEEVIELGLAGHFNTIKEVEYALTYLKSKIEELDPTDFLD